MIFRLKYTYKEIHMGTILFTFPIKEGKLDAYKQWSIELSKRAEEIVEFNQRYDITRHASWLAQMPSGSYGIVLLEGPGAETLNQELAESGHQFDRWFQEWIDETIDTSLITFPQSSIESNHEEASVNHLKIDLDGMSDGIASALVDHLSDNK